MTEPCNTTMVGRYISDHCDECDHVLAAHRSDRICSVCIAVAELRSTAIDDAVENAMYNRDCEESEAL